jgi:2-C-methyl-D-erythritol 4-phosphate cytidylyltransferase
MGPFAVIFPAAGKSSRFGDPKQKKIYAELDGRAVWLRAVESFVNRDDVGQMILAIAPEDRELFERRYRASATFMDIRVIEGGAERSDTVARALEAVDPRCEFVAIHDAARPCLAAAIIDAAFAAAREHGAALPAIPVADTIKRVGDDGRTAETVPREGLYLAQTPQVFRRELLCEAYARRAGAGARMTDDCQLVEAIGHPCTIVEGSRLNIKITTHEDLKLAAAILPLVDKKGRPESSHRFLDEREVFEKLPRVNLSDLFGP